jgi:chaperonin GroEL
MKKQTLYGKQAREKILSGVNQIADAVAVTLGPLGRNVVIARATVIDYGTHNFPLQISKDGVTVAKAFDVDDPFEKIGVLAVKEAAEKTVMQAGDGTTTTTVLLRAIVTEGIKMIDDGANPMELKREIDKAVEYVVGELRRMATPIKKDINRIRQIATVSANNDSSIGDLIAEAIEKIGEEGVIDIESSNGVNTEIKLADGYKFNKGWLSPLFVNKKEKQVCEFDNPLILLYDKRVTHHTQIQKALELSMQAGKPIVIICEDADQEGLAFLAMNNLQGRVRCCIVTAPDFGDLRREGMEDIATVTGGIYLSDTKGVSVKEVTINQLGKAKKIIITKEETVIIGGEGKKDTLENLLNELRMNLAQAKNEDEKAPIEKRIAKLIGGVAVIQVGAATETEMKERLDRFDDAVRATKAAISEGYVVGGGTAFIRIKADGIIGAVLEKPLAQILYNAGEKPVQKKRWQIWKSNKSLIEQLKKLSGNTGYNARTEAIEDLVSAGIIDPVKVLRCSLQNAASVAGMLLTSEAVIADTF